ncbi:type IV secretory system conjugative DNA transfer family protein [Robertmurraya sp. FSL R5-0851]|uniref:type IV secretory system conjugative DNA transfer family protein n=1 Tax=Robertmurraya sp. FSL R5-0851 TaxID=2921584 RepID=UPI0030F5DAED
MKDKLLPKLPLITVSVLGTVSVFLTIRAMFNYFFLMVGQFMGVIPMFILFGDPTSPGRIGYWLSALVLIVGWLVSTKFKKFQVPKWRVAWFLNMALGMLFYFLWMVSAPVYNSLLPYLGNRITSMDVSNIWLSVAVGDTNTLLLTIMFIPTAVTLVSMMWLAGQYSQYSKDLNEAFWEFEFKNAHLQKLFKLEKKEHWPDVVLGPSSETKELIVQPGRDRTLNNIIIGSIGTGKTAALVLPIINQDLHWMTRFINDYPNLYKREDYDSEEVKGMYLNGISVIEPSNDLCQKAFQLVKAHGIPEESVFYIDPTNPNTPSINPMQGPVDKVAEAFAMVIEGLAEDGGGGNDFFKQSERNHLKHYIYLLKLHDPEQEVTFDMLLKMYDNSNLVRNMHVKLKKQIPTNINDIEDRDKRNHWAIVKQIDEWFDSNLLPRTERAGSGNVPKLIPEGEYRGQQEFYDAKAEYVQGLRNILNDIGANPLIRRVLFGKSDFDFDKHLESGGVLLVNTAKGEMAGLSNILGKLVLLSLQNAVFRRKPNTSTFHHIICDEFPDYIYAPFREFPAQSRKYKTIITVVAQTIAQLADKYGETYMHTLLGTLRHKMVYGDIPDFDAQLFSKIFGEAEKFEEGIQEQAVSPLQEKPMLRMGNTYTKAKEAILSPNDIIFQKPFQCAVKIVAENKPVPVVQIDANFVPKDEFKEAVVYVDEEAASIWLENRRGIVLQEDTELLEEFEVLEEEEVIEEDSVEKEPLLVFPGKEQPVDLDSLYSRPSKPEPMVLPKQSEEIPEKEPMVFEKTLESELSTIEEESLSHLDIETPQPSKGRGVTKDAEVSAPVVVQSDKGSTPSPINHLAKRRAAVTELGSQQKQLEDELLKSLEEVEPSEPTSHVPESVTHEEVASAKEQTKQGKSGFLTFTEIDD